MYLGFKRISQQLPIFRREDGETVLFYTPGYLVRASSSEGDRVERDITQQDSTTAELFTLIQYAQRARQAWINYHHRLFEPVCLTLYPENRCNLHCPYCYAAPAPYQSHTAGAARTLLDREAVRAAAGLVAANCRERDLPFTLVMHGGGEPTLSKSTLQALLRMVEAVADQEEIGLFKYIATNGVLSVAKARWLAGSFQLIGLSCDGPEEIQKRQRPLPGGKSSSFYVERTAAVFRDAGTPFNVRVTLTPETFTSQADIIDYICTHLQPQEIHIEPVYLSGRAANGAFAASADLAQSFITHFSKARERAELSGVPLLFSGTRPWEIHGPYCHFFRDVLNLVPGDLATPCFKLSDAAQVNQFHAAIGQTAEDAFFLDYPRIAQLANQLSSLPAQCADCFNQFHCVRGCPDECSLTSFAASNPAAAVPSTPPEFRCQAQMLLANAVIERAAARVQLDQEKKFGGINIQVNG
jgi:sulfatase maturation enzyme AslB (radical SAM superfamily)